MLEPLFKDVSTSTKPQALSIEGQMPSDLRGKLFRVGVGKFTDNGEPTAHWFDGDGAVVSIDIRDGKATGHCQLLEVQPTEADPRRQHLGKFGKSPPRLMDRIRGIWDPSMYLNSANTALLSYQDRMFALYEAAFPTEFDEQTLRLKKVEDFGILKRAFTAHPKFHSFKNQWVAFGFRIFPRPVLDIFTLPLSGQPHKLGEVPYNGSVFVHDFAVTENHAVFFLSPVFVNPVDMIFKGRSIDQCMQFAADKKTEILIVPLANPGQFKKISAPAFLFTHCAAAFESEGKIKVWGIRYQDGSNLDWIRSAWPNKGGFASSAPGQLCRWDIDLQSYSLKESILSPSSIEVPSHFPKNDPRYIYAAGYSRPQDAASGFYNSLYKFDLHSKTEVAFFSDKKEVVSEMIVVPKNSQSSEEQAYGLTLHFHQVRQQSCLCVFDLQTSGPALLARAWFHQALPFTFHGLWKNSAQQNIEIAGDRD